MGEIKHLKLKSCQVGLIETVDLKYYKLYKSGKIVLNVRNGKNINLSDNSYLWSPRDPCRRQFDIFDNHLRFSIFFFSFLILI